jgi:hypothetical protein
MERLARRDEIDARLRSAHKTRPAADIPSATGRARTMLAVIEFCL